MEMGFPSFLCSCASGAYLSPSRFQNWKLRILTELTRSKENHKPSSPGSQKELSFVELHGEQQGKRRRRTPPHPAHWTYCTSANAQSQQQRCSDLSSRQQVSLRNRHFPSWGREASTVDIRRTEGSTTDPSCLGPIGYSDAWTTPKRLWFTWSRVWVAC